MIGGSFAALSAGIESVENYSEGYGFGTNDGRLGLMLKRYAGAKGTQNETSLADKAISFVQKRFGLTKVLMGYNPDLSDYGVTHLPSGNVEIGPAAFENISMLKATVIHEFSHSTLNRVFMGNRWTWNLPDRAAWNMNDGTTGYRSEIINSGRMHIHPSSFGTKDHIINPVWYSGTLKNKWFYTIPLRY